MKQLKLSIRYVISIAKINKRGLSPISCRLTYKKKRKPFGTGLFVNPSCWDAKKQKAISSSMENEQVNQQLQIISANIKKEYLKLQLIGTEFTVDEIFQGFLGKPVQKETYVIAYFQEYLLKRKKLIGIDIQLTTWKKFNYACSQAKDFIKWKYGTQDLALTKLKLNFLHDFEYYLKTERKQGQVTINKAIQRFRKPICIAVAEGHLNKDPFALHMPGKVKKEVIFLSHDELKLLEGYIFIQPRLTLVKDLFIFCCYTGLAYNEMNRLTREHIIKGFDGNQWIQMKREKTGKQISVPLLPKAKVILNKYKNEADSLLPRFSNQKINSYLKEIAAIVGINKSISHHMARKTFASTILLYNDVPMEIVSELLGHSSIKITQEYYGKIVQERVSEEINRISIKIHLSN